MDIKFKNDLKNNIMKMIVSVKKRKLASEEKIRLKWFHIEPLLVDYECPKTHVLGRCLNPIQTVDNDREDQCVVTWDFLLEEKLPYSAKVVKATGKTTSAKTTKKTKKTSTK